MTTAELQPGCEDCLDGCWSDQQVDDIDERLMGWESDLLEYAPEEDDDDDEEEEGLDDDVGIFATSTPEVDTIGRNPGSYTTRRYSVEGRCSVCVGWRERGG